MNTATATADAADTGNTDTTPRAKFVSGANTQDVDLPADGSVTVQDLIDRYRTLMNLPTGSNSQILVNGAAASADTVVKEGDTVEIVKAAGEKG